MTPILSLSIAAPSKVLKGELAGHDDIAGGEAAIHGQGDAGYGRGRVGSKKRRCARDIHGLDDAAERIPADELGEHLGLPGGAPLPQRCPYRAGKNRIGTDTETAVFERKRA